MGFSLGFSLAFSSEGFCEETVGLGTNRTNAPFVLGCAFTIGISIILLLNKCDMALTNADLHIGTKCWLIDAAWSIAV